MNCEEYRQAIMADPSGSFETQGHVPGCAACAAYRLEVRSLDGRLERALSIDVPPLEMPDLPPIPAGDARPGFAGLGWRRPRPAVLGAGLGVAAAGLVALAILLAGAPGRDGNELSLAGQIVAHMDHEEGSRQLTSVAVPAQRLGQVVGRHASLAEDDMGLITYAMNCVINGRAAPHLVIQGRTGPITLILLPGEEIGEPIPLRGVRVHGVILPVGLGSVAIIGERDEQVGEINRIGAELENALRWRT